MRIEALHEFTVLARVLNYRKTAEQLFISKSTLSKHIAELEDDLGVTLFERDSQTVLLTAEGSKIYQHALRVLEAYGELLEECPDKTEPVITVGASIRFNSVGQLISRALSLTDSNNVRIIDTGISGHTAEFEQGKFDLYFNIREFAGGNYGYLPLSETKGSVWVPKSSPFLNSQEISISDLNGMIYRPIEGGDHPSWTNMILSNLKSHGASPIVGRMLDDQMSMGTNDFTISTEEDPGAVFPGLVQLRLKENIPIVSCAIYPKSKQKKVEPLLTALQQAASEIYGAVTQIDTP